MWGPSRGFPYTYTIGRKAAAQPGTSPTELVHIVIAYLVLSFDFVLLYEGPTFYQGPVLVYFGVAGAAALTGFVCHELAHKLVAQRSGYWAEFRLSPVGLVVSLVTAYFGFLFAAPGATEISAMEESSDWGRTALAGPATNFVFGLIFFGTSLVTPSDFVAGVLLFLAYVNGWFAAFNMIPIGPLDGRKVYRWNGKIWLGTFLLFGAFAGLLFTLVFG